MSKRQGPPKHQNTYAWKPNLNQKINETEPGGRFRPLAEITGVCQRCRDQIDWKRRYGKYKQIVEPAKCQKCGKRAVRQAYHNVCRDCSKNLGICAKCCTRVNELMNKGKGEDSGPSVPKVADRSREGDIFPAGSLDEYAEQAREQDDSDEAAGDFVED
nr:unnamed protein product [Digitaria exilis]